MAVKNKNIGPKVYLIIVSTIFIPLAILNENNGLNDPLLFSIVVCSLNSILTILYFKKNKDIIPMVSLILIQIYFGYLLFSNNGNSGYIIPMSYVPIGAIIFVNERKLLFIFLPILAIMFLSYVILEFENINGFFYTVAIPIAAYLIIGSSKLDFFNLKDDLNNESDKLKTSNKDLEQFVYATAHNLKSPILGVHHLSQYLEEDHSQSLNTEAKSLITGIKDQSKKMETTLNDLLRYSTLSSLSPTLETFKFEDFLENISIDYPIKNSEKIGFTAKTETNITSSKELLHEALSHIISNGFKFNNSEIKKVNIKFENNILTIQDNGIGIPKEYQSRVFELFYRLNNDADFGGGTGAGLAICMKVFSILHLDYEITSTKEGTKISIDFSNSITNTFPLQPGTRIRTTQTT